MDYVIAGLGNPGEKYEKTRHNVGRMVLEHFRDARGFSPWQGQRALRALTSEGVVDSADVLLVEPDNYMNNSGKSLALLMQNKKDPSMLIVVYDDIDLPLGGMRISYNRGSGGHNGVASIIKELGTKAFIRVRVGICPVIPTGEMKKPAGDALVHDFILSEFRNSEEGMIGEAVIRASEALDVLIRQGRVVAMEKYNKEQGKEPGSEPAGESTEEINS